jgi:alkanesulfonate monooxygenase SsuD/methylene tetrahydromethanopterin reductase-like flavin-dependent oxidoreductase (luciferase family)
VADEAGFDCWWEVEHHCTPDFSYSSCPELILEAIALNTKRLRIGHAGVLVPFEINHPLRAAERAAMLDHISGGRLEVGLAKSGGKEWETFGVSEQQAAADLVEATRMLPRAWCDSSFSWHSPRWKVAERTVLPKPVQRPHPPLWHTCSSPPSFERAGQLGVGVLGTTLFAPVDALQGMINGYRKAIAQLGKPTGRVINDSVGIFTFVHVADSTRAAIASDIFYTNIRGSTDPRSRPASNAPLAAAERPDPKSVDDPNPVVALLKREFAGEEISNEEIFEVIGRLDSVIIGDVASCRKKMERFRDIGVDRLMCLVQMGEVPHAQVLSTLRCIGRDLIPHFA